MQSTIKYPVEFKLAKNKFLNFKAIAQFMQGLAFVVMVLVEQSLLEFSIFSLMGWIFLILFSVLTFVGLNNLKIQYLKKVNKAVDLTILKDGFKFYSFFKIRTYYWEDIDTFWFDPIHKNEIRFSENKKGESVNWVSMAFIKQLIYNRFLRKGIIYLNAFKNHEILANAIFESYEQYTGKIVREAFDRM